MLDINSEKNIIIKLDGRMGNQMFQWAFARAFEYRNGILPLFDDSEETLKLTPFKLSQSIKTVEKPLWNKFLRKTVPFRNLRNRLTKINYLFPKIRENAFNKYTPDLLTNRENICIQGFFQTEKYFSNIRNQILTDFTITKPLNKNNQQILEKIISTNSVSVHFRRGDYTKERVAKIFGTCSENYYKKAIKIIQNKSEKNITLFIFSDDIKWVKNNIKFDNKTFFVDVNSGKQGIYDLILMKNCKHNIIANSSFSWWGAWLNENLNKIVIAPTPWMENTENNDLIPENWILVNK